MTANRHEKGKQGEDIAARFLEECGIRIIAQNVRSFLGEIDIIGRDGNTVVFVEVKSRSFPGYGLPQESVTLSKQRRLTRLAQWYIKTHGLERRPARFDVIAITWKSGEPEVTWIPNAFEARE
ncbi:MAG: YraN family protein [Syntrophobacteraceae bacterium]